MSTVDVRRFRITKTGRIQKLASDALQGRVSSDNQHYIWAHCEHSKVGARDIFSRCGNIFVRIARKGS